jgi:hypothetical protein
MTSPDQPRRPLRTTLLFLSGAVFAVVLAAASIGGYVWLQRNKAEVDASASVPDDAALAAPENEVATEAEAEATPALQPEYADAVFAGDEAWFVKGPLLDPSAKAEWDALPQRLGSIGYGTRVFCVDCDREPFGEDSEFSPLHDHRPEMLADFAKQRGQSSPGFVRYMSLAVAGKVAFPRLEGTTDAALLTRERFMESYGAMFDNHLRGIPGHAKRAILDWNNMQEEDWTFADHGNIDPRGLFSQHDFNRDGSDDVAVVMHCDTCEDYRLLVFASRDGQPDYLLHEERIAGRALLKALHADPEERWEREIYMGGAEKALPDQDPLLVTPQEGTPYALVYDPKFDAMRRYEQRPGADTEGNEKTKTGGAAMQAE